MYKPLPKLILAILTDVNAVPLKYVIKNTNAIPINVNTTFKYLIFFHFLLLLLYLLNIQFFIQ